MPDFPKLVIDIGTNSILALLSVMEDGRLRVISDRKITTKLGEGLIKTGQISQSAMKRGIDAVTKLLETTNYNSVEILATEALRIAQNSSEFVASVKNITGQTIELTMPRWSACVITIRS